MEIYKFQKVDEKVWQVDECFEKIQEPEYLLYSEVNRDNEQNMLLSKIDFNFHKNFIIFGLKNIELLKEIYKRKTPFSTIVIIEICESNQNSLYINSSKEDLEFLTDKSRVNLVIGDSNEIIKQLDSVLGEMLKLYNLRNVEIMSMPYLKSLYPLQIENISKIILERLRTFVVSYGNSVEDILEGMDNYISNWGHVFRGIDNKSFINSYANKPAIIVGAGPSLDINLHLLKDIKGKALILCVDAALNTLIDAGIIPDVVGSIERIELTSKFYKRQQIPAEIVFVGPSIVKESILERFERIIFTGRTGDVLIREFNDYIGFNNLNIGGNISNVLLAFAEYIGCNPIVFVGLDLAYTGGKTHTERVSKDLGENAMGSYKENTVYVRGQRGELLETSEFFMYAKNWIEMNINEFSQRKFINSTEGGALIEGTQNIALKDVIFDYCNDKIPKFSDIYDNLMNNYNPDKVNITQKAMDFITEMDKGFKKVSKTSSSYYEKLKTYGKVGLVSLMESHRGKMEAIFDKNKVIRFILQSITISYHRDIHSFPMYLSSEDEQKMLDRNLNYYDTIKKVSDRISEDLKVYKKVLEYYLNKYKGEGTGNEHN